MSDAMTTEPIEAYIPFRSLKTALVNSCASKIEMIDTKNSFTAYIVIYIYWLHNGFGLEHGDGSFITPMALAHALHPVRSRLRNKCRNLWVRWKTWCVSSWRPWFCPIYSIHYLGNWDKPFLWYIYIPIVGVANDRIGFGVRVVLVLNVILCSFY